MQSPGACGLFVDIDWHGPEGLERVDQDPCRKLMAENPILEALSNFQDEYSILLPSPMILEPRH